MKNVIGCDSLHCSVKWYHFLCAGIYRKTMPEGKLLCIFLPEKLKYLKLNGNHTSEFRQGFCLLPGMWCIILIFAGVRPGNMLEPKYVRPGNIC